MAKKSAKRPRPSFTGLLRIRSQIRTILRSLSHAQAKTSDVHENTRLIRARVEIEKRLERLEWAVTGIKGLHEQRQRYEGRIALLDQKTDRLLGRQFRAGQRWLRRWETL